MAGALIFAATYVLISARRLGWMGLDRPSAALLGAVACVALGVLGPSEALAAVDGKTLVLLFGMMGMGAFLGAEGFFDRAAESLSAWARTPARLLAAVVWGAGIFSALITNDAICVLCAPLVVVLIRRHGLPALPFLLALATAANTGSAATLVGNPQNILCAGLGGLAYRDHLLLAGPAALAGLAINHLLLWLLFRSRLRGTLVRARTPRVFTGGSIVVLGVLLASAALYTAGADLAWTSAGGCAALFLLRRAPAAEIWRRVDWSILLFFACLFVVVEGFSASGAPALFFERFPVTPGEGFGGWLRMAGLFLVGSNVVSNVPFILVVRGPMDALPDPRMAWELLAVASTFAGNLTLLGSVANVIVAEKGREVGGLGFWSHLRAGLPITVATTLAGAAWLYWAG